MPSWKGNPTNPAPNIKQELKNRSELDKVINRSYMTRRDTDKVKDFTVTLMDIDGVIMDHLHKMNLQVPTPNGNTIVPVMYGAHEVWTSIQKYGYMRDYNGKIILPALVVKRTNTDNDSSMATFNRYLRYPIIKQYSQKNRYTKFSQLIGQNVPVHEVYNVVAPDYVVVTYSFIVWTEKVEQMNFIIERIKFDTEDYWFDNRGFKFRTRIEGFDHTTEVNMGEDRVVKTEFTLMCNAYLLPDLFDGKKPTTIKTLTPKKVVMGMEVVESDYDMSNLGKDESQWAEWKSKKYPNIDQKDEPESPPVVFQESAASNIVETNYTRYSSPTTTSYQALFTAISESAPTLEYSPLKEYLAGNYVNSASVSSAKEWVSGVYNATQSNVINQPMFLEDGGAGHPAFRFNGTDALRSIGFTLTQPNTILVVASLDFIDTTADYIIDGMTIDGRQAIYLGSGTWNLYAGNAILSNISASVGNHIFVAQFNGASSTIYVDGASDAGDAGSLPMEGISLAVRYTFGNSMTGNIQYVLIWDTPPSSTLLNSVITELSSLYNIPIS